MRQNEDYCCWEYPIGLQKEEKKQVYLYPPHLHGKELKAKMNANVILFIYFLFSSIWPHKANK